MTRHYFMGMLCAVAIASLGAAVAAADDGEIRLMSYNILHGKGADRKVDIRRTAAAIVRERPDFVGLQEVDCRVSRSGRIDEPAELARLTGLHPTFASAFPYQGGEYGRAILSREKPLSVERIQLDGKRPGVLLLCEFPDFWFGTMHLDLAETNRLRQVGIVRAAVAEKSRGKPVFLTGDWNATPKSRTLAAMREFMTVLSTENSRTFHGFKGGKIAKDYCIDYIAVDKAHAKGVAVKETHVTEEPVASDHNLVVAVVALSAVGMPAIDPRVPPIFSGHVMTNETVLFMGTDDVAPLMYKADEILSVTSFDLKTEYKEGVDWTFDRVTRTIRPTPNTRMPYYKESEWYPAKGRFRCVRPGKPFVFFSEGSVISLHQVCVTYSHSDSWDGPALRSDAAAFAPMLSELASRKSGTTVFYGDSITYGYNSSGKFNFAPFIPDWPTQIHSAIVSATGNSGIKYVNTAIAGKNVQWGLNNVKAKVIDHAPDFVLIAFGMNDSMPAAAYSAKTEAMVNAIHSALPNAAVMLVPPMEPNPEAKGFAKGKLFAEYERALCALAEKFRAAGFARIGCANVNTMHAAVLARKRYRDMTGNNVNHCNDFSARIYRDAILAAMGILPAHDAR